jgi:membrane-associated protease RseP (regulator of RpoE activity)
MNSSEQESGDASKGALPAATDADVTYVSAQVPVSSAEPEPDAPSSRPRRRRIRLPLVLFLLTCASTFLAGATQYKPLDEMLTSAGLRQTAQGMVNKPPSLMHFRQTVYRNWREGVMYMACILAILLAHEMGHFAMTVVHRVRASLPLFIPLPISPFGTMGAVIAMDGRQANRRQIFDIGLAGPLAGLVIALPVMWIGVEKLDLSPGRSYNLQAPLIMRLAIDYLHPGQYNPAVGISLDSINAWLMAGWVGLLVTGLNMLPVSQLDGGHVTYALFGRRAHWIARGFMLVVFVYMVAVVIQGSGPTWILMAILVLLIGTDHPPTSDDTVKLGWFRTALGYASLAIPIFCFVPNPIITNF